MIGRRRQKAEDIRQQQELAESRLRQLQRFPELGSFPRGKWQRYIEIHDPKLPIAANVGVLEYGRLSTEAFVAKVPAAWSQCVGDLAAKLNATAMVIALQEPVREPVLAPLEADTSRTLDADNILAAIWLMITVFFSEGEEAASYFFVALEAMTMTTTVTSPALAKDWSATVARLNIPAPHNFWDEPSWHSPRIVMSLILVLASPKSRMKSTMEMLSRSRGEPEPDIARMDTEPSMSLHQQYLAAKEEAEMAGKTTMFGVDLVDKGLIRLKEEQPGSEKAHLSFRRMFIVGVCPKGVKIWLAGGEGRSDTLKEHNERQGHEMMEANEVEQFMLDFDRIVAQGTVSLGCCEYHVIRVADKMQGRWNTKSYKWYERCFGVDLRELQKETGKGLLVQYEAWVQLYPFWDIKKEHIAKLQWE